MLKANVCNMPSNPRKYVVAKVVNNQLWYWMSFDTEKGAEESADNAGDNAIVLEVEEYVSDCANYESCREDAYNDGYEDAVYQLTTYLRMWYRVGVNTLDEVIEMFKNAT